ncbi:MAG TPA: hypothetical protein GXX52_03510 [Synergistaceae bacterium]|nr:hypothetical protein [Synergistaceae bacterium]
MYHGREAKAYATFDSAADAGAVAGKALRLVDASRGAWPLHMARHLSINAMSLWLASPARSHIALAVSKSPPRCRFEGGMGGFVEDFMGLLDLLEAGLSALSPFQDLETIHHLADERLLRRERGTAQLKLLPIA